MGLADEKYVVVTTFRTSGASVSTPTWIVPLDDGRVGFWTSSTSGKAKRLRNDARVTVQPSDARGKIRPSTTSTGGTAVLTGAGPDFDVIRSRVKAKYGVMVTMSRLFNVLGHLGKASQPYGDVGVVITLDA